MLKKIKIRKPKTTKVGLPPGSLVYTGDRAAVPPQVRTVWYNQQVVEVFEHFNAQSPLKDAALWLDIRGLTDIPLIQQTGERFNIHPLVLEDVLNTRQRPKSEDYDNGLFVVVPNIRFNKTQNDLEYEQISLFLTQKAVISFQEDPDDTLLPVLQRLQDPHSRIRQKGSDYLLYAAMDTIIDYYFLGIEAIEEQLVQIETEIHGGNLEEHTRSDIFSLRRTLNQLRHSVYPMRDAVSRMVRVSVAFQKEENLIYLRDVSDHIVQVLDQLETFRDHLSNLEALYHAEVSNRMNNVMKLLTVISTIFIPLSFIAGVYGMNFDNMPELHWHYGYFYVLAFMFTVFAGMMVYFKKKNWL